MSVARSACCEPRGIFRQFGPYTRGERRRLLAGGILAVVVSAAEIAAVLIFDDLTNKVLAARHVAGFWVPAGLWLAVAAAQRLSPDFFDRRRLGDQVVRFTEDVPAVEELVGSGLAAMAAAAVSAVLFAAAAIYLSWTLALVAAVAAPLFGLVSRMFAGPMGSAAAVERQAAGAVSTAVEESLSGQALVQAFNRQHEQAARLRRAGRISLGGLLSFASAARVAEILGTEPRPVRDAGCLSHGPGYGRIEFDGVSVG